MRNLREYLWAESPGDALRLLRECAGRGALLAGGTCLAVRDDPGLDFVVDLGRLGLDRIEADPCDLVLPCCLVLETRALVLASPASVPEWVPLESALAPRANPALLLGIEIAPSPRTGFALECLSRSELDSPLAAIAAAVECDSGRMRSVRVATSGVDQVPRRARHAEAALLGRTPDAETFGAAQAALEDDMSPRGDHRASAEYRAHLARVLLSRALRRAVESAGEASTR